MKINGKKITKRTDLTQFSIAELTEAYNEVAERPIKKFASKAKAIERIRSMTAPKRKKSAGGGRGRPPNISNDATLRVLVDENPKRKNTKAHAKFSYIMRSDGKTFGHVRKHLSKKYSPVEASEELSHCVKMGFIEAA